MSTPQPDLAAKVDTADVSSYCLYFLPSAATSGELAGLFKLGVAESLPLRYGQHRQKWGAFDLRRAAVLRGCTRREAYHLERVLHGAFGNPDLEAAARAQGRQLNSEELRAAGSWRRHPGRCGDGHTEFYGVGCLDQMLDLVEYCLRLRGERPTRAHLQRGLTSADCALRPDTDDVASLTREERRERRMQQKAKWQQEREEFNARIASKVRALLDLTLAYEEHIVWVDLSRWRRAHALPGYASAFVDVLADLYLAGFGVDTFAYDEAQRPAVLRCLQEEFTRIEAHLPGQHPRLVRTARVAFWEEPPFHESWRVAPPACCEQALRLRLFPEDNRPVLPFLVEFEALARRVEARRRGEQPDLPLPSPGA